MKAFLMIGQSNMAGRGDFYEVPEIHNDHCFMLRNGRWQPMNEPINPDRGFYPVGELKIHSGIGLAASFADEFQKYFNEEIGLIPCADGGTRIFQWQPGEPLYLNAVCQTKLALRDAELAGILWHHGETDAYSLENVAMYKDRFFNMMVALRNEIGANDVPIIMGELGNFVRYYKNGKFQYITEMNEVIHQIADEMPNCIVASSDGLACRFDNLHFNSASYRELGRRYFQKYVELTGK